ncbi:ERIC3 protein, partial [Crypturellus undulatus]|nr:ERIC3 protein [Crypturellus undulatus]
AAASRPNTAPGNLQAPLQRQPLRSGTAVAALPKTSGSKQRSPALENDQQFASGGEKSKLRLMNSIEYVTGISPYRLPIINNYVIPVPPPPLQTGDRSVKTVRNGMPRRRRFRPTTAPNDLAQLLTKNSGKFHKPSLHSNALVTMIFLGKGVHLCHDDTDFRDEIKVYQQHCGGENLCVYKGKLLEGETFQFISKRHHGFPFSLTFFLNGMQVDRLSSCCEYKHQKHSRLGGRHGYFGFLNVERASPCYRCIIAMGLGKKPSPPKKKMKEENHEEQAVSLRAGVHREPSESCAEQKTGKDSMLAILSGHGARVEPMEDKMETGEDYRRAETKDLSDHETEESQEDTGENDYDEDFEADEEVNEEGQISDQMSGMSKSSSDDEKDNLDHEKESRNSSQNDLQASDSEKDENDGHSDSDSEDNEQDRRSADCSSSVSTLYSSEDDSAEKFKDNVKGNGECDIERAAGNVALTGCGNENGENDQARMEDNPETFALEKEGIDEAEETEAARISTDFFHENITAIQHQDPEVSGCLEDTGSVEGNTREDGKKVAYNGKEDGEEDVTVSLEGYMMEVKDRNEESPQSDKGGVPEKTAEAINDDHHMNPELEPSDSRAEEKENLSSTEHIIKEAPDGASLAEETRTLEIQKAAEQVVQEGQMAGEKQALEKEDFVAEEGGAHREEVGQETTLEGDLLSQEGTGVAVLGEGELAAEKSAPEERTVTEEDSKEEGEEKTGEDGEVTFGEQEVLKDVQEGEEVLSGQTPEGEEVLGALMSLGKEVDGAEPEEAQVVEGAVEEAPEAEERVSESGLEAEEAAEEGGFAGKDVVEFAVAEGQEAVQDEKLAEEAVEEADSEGEEAVEMLGALLETSGKMDVCTQAAVPGREELKESSEFPQLFPDGEEWMKTGKAATGAALSKTDEPSEVGESSLLRAEDAVEATCSS